MIGDDDIIGCWHLGDGVIEPLLVHQKVTTVGDQVVVEYAKYDAAILVILHRHGSRILKEPVVL